MNHSMSFIQVRAKYNVARDSKVGTLSNSNIKKKEKDFWDRHICHGFSLQLQSTETPPFSQTILQVSTKNITPPH